MRKIYSFLLLTCLLLIGTNAWADEVTIASFSHDTPEGWTITNAEYATASGGYYKLISSDAAIVSPAATWSDYTNIKITITARKFGGPDATQGKISVVQGNNELTSYSPASTSCVASSELSISPAEGAITIACLGASSNKGCGVQSIVIKGTPAGDTPPQPTTYSVTYDCDGATSCPEDEINITAGSSITLPAAPEKDGFSFAGWNDGTSTYNAGASYTVNSNVTMTAQWNANVGGIEWVLASLANLEETDEFVIVGNNGNTYAMSNDKGTGNPPAAIAITVSDNKITSSVADAIIWTIEGNATDGYTFYPKGSTTTWLYCTNSNNGVRVGTNDNKTFKMVDNYLNHVGTSRYVGIYNNADWRCYTTINSNISGQTFAFYKKVAIDPSDPSVATAITINATGITNTDVYEGTAAGSLSAVVKAGETTIDGAVVTWTSSDENVATINENTGVVTLVAAGTTTITATYAGVENQYKPSTKTYELTITDTTPIVYSTIPDLFNAATSSEADVLITFNNWVVSGISSNGKNVYVTDGTNGFIIYDANGLASSYSVNDILSGTAVSCKLKLYGGAAEILNLNAEDLTITPGGSISPANVAMSDLSGVNTGALVQYDNLLCSKTSEKYYLSDGTTTIQLYNAIFAYTNPVVGKRYNVTGIYVQYNSTKEVLPRSNADLEVIISEVEAPEFSPAAGTFAAAQTVTITCETENAAIYYTTNGEEPDNTSAAYTTPIAVNASMTIKAIAYVGNVHSVVATAVYNIVTIEHAGTEADPYSIADAKNVIEINNGSVVNGKYVHGIISQIDSYNSNFNSITYWISEDGTTTDQFEVYSGKKLGNTNFAAVSNLTLGDEVVVYGNIKKYNSTYEFDHSNYIVSHKSKLTISSVGYATYFNSANAYTMPENCVGNVFTIANGLEEAYGEGDVVPADEPLVIYTIEPGTKTLIFTESDDDTYASLGMNDLKGTDAAATTTGGDVYYALSLANGSTDPATVGFYWMAANGAAFTNGAHKAYLALSANQAPARYYLFNEESNATDIQNVEGAEKAVKFIENGKLYIQKNGVVYDAMGKTVR